MTEDFNYLFDVRVFGSTALVPIPDLTLDIAKATSSTEIQASPLSVQPASNVLPSDNFTGYATMQDGSPLPKWIKFNATTLTFTINIANAVANKDPTMQPGEYPIRYFATMEDSLQQYDPFVESTDWTLTLINSAPPVDPEPTPNTPVDPDVWSSLDYSGVQMAPYFKTPLVEILQVRDSSDPDSPVKYCLPDRIDPYVLYLESLGAPEPPDKEVIVDVESGKAHMFMAYEGD